MWLINIIIYTILVVPYSILYIKNYRFTPVSVFLIMEINYFYQICFAPKGQLDYAIRLETIYVVSMAFFIIGVELSKRCTLKCGNTTGRNITCADGNFIDEDLSKTQTTLVWLIIIVSILLCTYLFAAGGMNVFIQSLKDFVSSETTTYKNERKAYFSVGGMGYIYQFRAILLPILSFYVAYCRKIKINKFFAYGLLLLMVIFLLGTGQRNAFVFFALVVLFYEWMMKREYGIKTFGKAEFIFLGCAGVIFLIALTISNGGVAEGDNLIAGALESLFNRAFQVNPRTAITAFSYIDTQPCCWGYDWLMMMKDILPGKSGYLSVSRITYYIAYGTYSGTGDPCVWGSAWYNFNVLGITIFPLIMGACYHRVYKTMAAFEYKNRMYMLIYAGLCVYLGMWTYGTPMNLFNIGVIALFILRWLIFKILGRQE